MDSLILIDGEVRSLIRNSLERVIGLKFKKYDSKYKTILLKIVIRIVSSLIAIQVYNSIKDSQEIKTLTSYSGILIFLLFLFEMI